VPVAMRTRIGNREMFVTVLWFCVIGLLLFCVNLEWPEHFAALTKAWVLKNMEAFIFI
jgi:hypothetical protein